MDKKFKRLWHGIVLNDEWDFLHLVENQLELDVAYFIDTLKIFADLYDDRVIDKAISKYPTAPSGVLDRIHQLVKAKESRWH